MRLVLAVVVMALMVGACSEEKDGGPDGEPFVFEEYIAGAEYVASVQLTGESGAGESSGLVTVSGIVQSVEWNVFGSLDPDRAADAAPPVIGQSIQLLVREGVALGDVPTVLVLVDDLRSPDAVERLVLLAMDSGWEPLSGNLAVAVAGFEAAIAETGIADRQDAAVAVLDRLTK